jgi:signal transduction histidine kinase
MSLHGALSMIGPNPQTATARVQAAIEDLDLTMKQIRTAIFGLESSGNDDESLRAQLLAVVRDAAGPLGFEPRVLLDGPIDTGLAKGVGVELVATLREALANIARHAHARRADVSITVEGEVTLEVRDDGVGPGDAFRAGGKGLANMRQRAESLGGTMQVQAAEPSGTVLTWRVPKG